MNQYSDLIIAIFSIIILNISKQMLQTQTKAISIYNFRQFLGNFFSFLCIISLEQGHLGQDYTDPHFSNIQGSVAQTSKTRMHADSQHSIDTHSVDRQIITQLYSYSLTKTSTTSSPARGGDPCSDLK